MGLPKMGPQQLLGPEKRGGRLGGETSRGPVPVDTKWPWREEQRTCRMGGLLAKSQGHGRQLGCACYGQGDIAPLAKGVQGSPLLPPPNLLYAAQPLVHPTQPNSHGDGHQELVEATEEHEGHVAQPDAARAVHEEDQPCLHRCHASDDQFRPQSPLDLHKARGKGGDGAWGDRTVTVCHPPRAGRAGGAGWGVPSRVEAASTPPL